MAARKKTKMMKKITYRKKHIVTKFWAPTLGSAAVLICEGNVRIIELLAIESEAPL